MKNKLHIRKGKYWFLVPVFFFCMMSYSQNFNAEVEAVINTNDIQNDILEISGVATNKTETDFSLRYELSVITSDTKNNSSKNSQSGRFTLAPYETKELSKTSLSINPLQRTILLLVLYDVDDKVVGTARKVYDEEEQEKAQEQMSFQKENEGIILEGMVTERTKTKPGKDFYDYFYQSYSLSPNKTNKMIHIDEIISFGRTTRIIVKVEDRIVHQFFARPKLDYLKEQADASLRQVNRYIEYLENRNEFNTKY